MLNEEGIKRVAELAGKWAKLRKWGIALKLPHTRDTQKDLDAFFQRGRETGNIDASEIVGITADIRRLEKYAEEYDQAHGGDFRREPLKTTFDIETSDDAVKAAKHVIESSNAVQAAAKDATKDAFGVLSDAAKNVPWWAYAAGGTLLATYILSQIATISRAFGRR